MKNTTLAKASQNQESASAREDCDSLGKAERDAVGGARSLRRRTRQRSMLHAAGGGEERVDRIRGWRLALMLLERRRGSARHVVVGDEIAEPADHHDGQHESGDDHRVAAVGAGDLQHEMHDQHREDHLQALEDHGGLQGRRHHHEFVGERARPHFADDVIVDEHRHQQDGQRQNGGHGVKRLVMGDLAAFFHVARDDRGIVAFFGLKAAGLGASSSSSSSFFLRRRTCERKTLPLSAVARRRARLA